MKHIVMGVLAHVDSGKTTLSEALLYLAGNIKKLGRVDKGSAFLDTFALERARGITIFSKQAVMQIGDISLTLLDTPGHVDFSAEAERTLQVLDCAVLVISGTDGVQSHTETLWRLLRQYSIPTFVFINKMDLAGADASAVMQSLNKRLGAGFVRFDEAKNDAFFEACAVCSDELTEQYLNENKLSDADIANAVFEQKIYPCVFGSALKLEGVDTLINTLKTYIKQPPHSADFAARVFKISRDAKGERLTHMKITGGTLKVKAALSGVTKDGAKWEEKANAIRIYSGEKFTAPDEVCAGEVCGVTGLSRTYAGEALGAESGAAVPVLSPVLKYKLLLSPDADAHVMLAMLRRLEEETPELSVIFDEQTQEISVMLMGEVQLEVLQSLIAERYGVNISFGQGSIVYKETLDDKSSAVEGVGHFEPLRHYAEVHLIIEPAPRDSGVTLESTCSTDALDLNWQRLILTHLAEKQHKGVLTGAPLTDVKITLAAGKAHLKHTEGGDFRQATYRAVRQGLMQAQSILLEPWYSFTLEVPTENIGRAMADIQKMHGEFDAPAQNGEMSTLTGSAPVASMQGYHTDVISYTHGRGRLACTLKGYAPCHNADEVIEKANYNPEADVENTPNSVFCAHGAGFNVSWRDVKNYMHLESALAPAPRDEEPPQNLARRAAQYVEGLDADKELLAIFEKTYGKVKNRAFDAMRAPTAPKIELKEAKDYREYLLVDGYNIIFAWSELSEIAKTNLDLARRQLINILCNYQGFRQCEVILVFDAYKVKGGAGEVEKLHNITVVYTKEAETADMYIEKAVRRLDKNRRVRVATSDGVEQLIILGQGALRLSANAFHDEVKAAEKAIKEYLSN